MTKELIRHLAPKADTAKCQGMACKTKNNCLRFLRPVAPYRQKWFEFWRDKTTPCPGYSPVFQSSPQQQTITHPTEIPV